MGTADDSLGSSNVILDEETSDAKPVDDPESEKAKLIAELRARNSAWEADNPEIFAAPTATPLSPEENENLTLEGIDLIGVDDESKYRGLVERMGIIKKAKSTRIYNDGAELIEALKRGDVPEGAIVLSDMQMEKMGGRATAEAINMAGRTDIKIILMSGECDPNDVKFLIESGMAKAFMAKPWDLDEMVKKILKVKNG
jgi:CheY-like chemotaxis protein